MKFHDVPHEDTEKLTLWKVFIPDVVPVRMIVEEGTASILAGRAALIWDDGAVHAYCRVDDMSFCVDHGYGEPLPDVSEPPVTFLRIEGGSEIEKGGTTFHVGGQVIELVVLSQDTVDANEGAGEQW